MKLEKKDRLMLINQYKILVQLNSNESNYYKELIEILENGYEIFYSMLDQWMDDGMPEEEGRFVLNILDLYRAIEDVKRKTRDEQLLTHHHAVFSGFDGNNEAGHLSFARFLIEVQNKFQEQKQYLFQNDNLNSHCPMIDKYQRMLETVTANDINIWIMDVEQTLKILDA